MLQEYYITAGILMGGLIALICFYVWARRKRRTKGPGAFPDQDDWPSIVEGVIPIAGSVIALALVLLVSGINTEKELLKNVAFREKAIAAFEREIKQRSDVISYMKGYSTGICMTEEFWERQQSSFSTDRPVYESVKNRLYDLPIDYLAVISGEDAIFQKYLKKIEEILNCEPDPDVEAFDEDRHKLFEEAASFTAQYLAKLEKAHVGGE